MSKPEMSAAQKAVELVRDFGELTTPELRRAWRARFGTEAPRLISFGAGCRSVARSDRYVHCAITGERVRPWVPTGRGV